MKMTGAQAVVTSLQKEGVEVIFGYPGGGVLPLYDALYDSPLYHILTRHEQGAAHAADGYARATGKVGVVIATSGPGATNLITGIATANMDSIPMVCITGQVGLSIIGKDSFQEADITGITTPITKHNYLVKNPADLPRIIREAFYIAQTGRPGPVVIDIPKDVFTSTIDYHYPDDIKLRGYKPIYEGKAQEIEDTVAVLRKVKKPLIFVGGGVISATATDLLGKLIDQYQIPLISSFMGLGTIPASHPCNLGMVGMHGTVAANRAVMDCDLLIGLGVRFDDRVTGLLSKFAPNAKIVHFDIDPAEVNKNVETKHRVIGHLKWSLQALLEKMAGQIPEETRAQWNVWLEQVQCCHRDNPLIFKKTDKVIKPQYVLQELDRQTKSNYIVVTDVGQHQMWTAQYYQFNRPRTLISSGGLGTMGFGLPAAIGVQMACPEESVLLITGDGSILMNCQEIATLVEHQLPVKVAIINNQALGMVRQWQRMFFHQRYSHSQFNNGGTDYVRLAEAFGATGLRATKMEEVPQIIAQALATDGPVFMDFQVCSEENVLPMVPAGASLDQMIEGAVD
ncbi:biosynthetic-type acetolactate synthase large subunit [Heliorestis acidaminivorans]|uniref:Acetolactate synthase n=1 Tax=Heliorestis acidaminivorans TaxID=553427 RepID=A0A6I0F3P8_9FIRM|nr:biosynthetic-type acetolactate synthase large subunit [Heliorestis acidaminivorans]KAB2954591.1 biosynthetic-type acetolactate synthase large subunit [Heliorestis acidaminivorans]